jgi:hypothetical protein
MLQSDRREGKSLALVAVRARRETFTFSAFKVSGIPELSSARLDREQDRTAMPPCLASTSCAWTGRMETGPRRDNYNAT